MDELPLSLELAPLLLDEGLDEELDEGEDEELGEAVVPVPDEDVSELVLPVLGKVVEPELVLPVLGEVVAPELMLPLLGGAPASLPDEDDPLPLAPDAPEELSPDEPELLPLAPALAPPPAAPPAPPPWAQAAVANATMAAVTAALMSFTFILIPLGLGWRWPAAQGDARTMPCRGKVRVSFRVFSAAKRGGTMSTLGLGFIAFLFVQSMQAHAEERAAVPQFQVDAAWPKPLPNRWILGQV